jgi:16S rRNA (uracil1498-N3)-methyltransferase
MKNITKTPRLFIEDLLAIGKTILINRDQSHYISKVLRLTVGDYIRLFNGKEGEFLACLKEVGKICHLMVEKLLKAQPVSRGPWLFFAPIKKDRMAFLVEKAVELGVGKLVPLITDRTIVRQLNIEKMRLNIIEASEQCERLDIPEIMPPISLKDIFKGLKEHQRLYFCKERSNAPLIQSLSFSNDTNILIGPEGGFTDSEISFLESNSQTQAISLGDRILRAETAALYALSHCHF